jgi:membrane associated rhomboid family serine protease
MVANIVIFLLSYGPHRHLTAGQLTVAPLRHWAEPFMLYPENPVLWQFITYAFLHASWLHIFGNMFFLYLFGNNVNDRLGHFWYLVFYVGGAVFSGVGHMILRSDPLPVLGASGAVAAATGAYVVLYPQTLITVLYWFFFIGTLEVPALYFILFKLIVWDNIVEPSFARGAVAHEAHLAGYAFGIVVMVLMLATGLMTGSNFDLWAMIRRWNRRRRYRDVVSSGYDPFAGRSTVRRINAKEVKKNAAQTQTEDRVNELRNGIANRIAQRNLSAAADLYLELMDLDNKQVLPRQHLLDIANQLASDQRPAESAQAYEQFLTQYGNYEYAEQVQLMLGILYSRYLDKPGLAVKYLQAAAEKLTDPGQLKMCKDELTKLQK